MARRLNGEGSIRHRADGRWECRVMDGYLDDGRRNVQTFYGRTQKEVREKLKEFLEARASGIDTRQRYTFGGWADVWYRAPQGKRHAHHPGELSVYVARAEGTFRSSTAE